jgi:hypothetical protein
MTMNDDEHSEQYRLEHLFSELALMEIASGAEAGAVISALANSAVHVFVTMAPELPTASRKEGLDCLVSDMREVMAIDVMILQTEGPIQ